LRFNMAEVSHTRTILSRKKIAATAEKPIPDVGCP
jgi:hypothetical protein